MLTIHRSNSAILALVVFVFVVSGEAIAQERKAYKYVDERGNVTYSQTPPASGQDAKKVDISPAHTGRGGYATRDQDYIDPDRYSTYNRRQEMLEAREAYRLEQQRLREEARQKRLAELEAACMRNRNADCKSAEALRYQESQSIPRAAFPRAR